ncbi:tetratricopeptide repeat protein [Maribacter sp. ANRC-HE7]|uniref:histidine kinase n=1 Tax=Maribacter aquimaris TaxID=2737171 RepID=A0ABR7V111_9FLAO|nr:tetratricopeptide repeat-containing sensor histidine kinase [Maribacter aquimaris]MBD0778468.1 tetratricopeptide repeat protein [Maribacter aquimaris]
MKRFLILISITLFVSCSTKHRDPTARTGTTNDSVLYYYTIAKDRNNPLTQRHNAVNKAFRFLKEDQKDTLYFPVLYQKSFIHFTAKEYDSLLVFNDLLIGQPSKNEDNDILARQHYLMAYYYDHIAYKPKKAFHHYNNSKNYKKRINDSSWIGKTLCNMAIIQKNHNDFFGSKETITEALHYLDAKKDSKYISSSYNVLATDHRKLLNYEEAIKYHLKAIATTESDRDRPLYQNNLAATYIDDHKYQEALTLLKEITKDSTLRRNKPEYARVLDNLAYAQWLTNKKVKEEAFLHPLDIRKKNRDRRGQIASYTHLGEYYIKRNPIKAKAYFDSVIQLSKTLNIPRAEKDALKHLMRLAPTNVALRDRYVFLQDSLYAQELKVKTQFAKYKYDDTLKQESILQLEKENAERALEVAKQRNQKIISYATLGLLVLASGFIGYFLMQRTRRIQQQNKIAVLEATYATEAALSRKLHDDFGGKLNHAMMLLQNGADSNEVLDIVEVLYNQSRNFSRKINDVDTGPHFKDLLFGMLGTYCKNTKLYVTGSKEVNWDKISGTSKKTLYKVFQELMTNMQKHSSATMVSIDFEQSKKALGVAYVDNGVGASKADIQNKNGLWNTEKRIVAINGSINFESEKGNGFKAHIKIPN